MNVTINILELASELAHERMLSEEGLPSNTGECYADAEHSHYNEEFQDYFNHWYDYYYSIIESCTLR